MAYNTWFADQFIPSICERMNNPKYPLSTILTDRQADICRKYMHPVQCHSDYGWFTIYEADVNGARFTMTHHGKYTILSRGLTAAERENWESQRQEEKATKEAEKIARIKADPERLAKHIARTEEELQKLINRKNSTEAELQEVIAEGDEKEIAEYQEYLKDDIEAVKACENKLANLRS